MKKVTKVKRVVKKSPREELISRIPIEVRETLPPGTLDTLSTEELEALIATGTDVKPIESPEDSIKSKHKESE